jgi:hypothetical protein
MSAGNDAAFLPTRSLRWREAAEKCGATYEPGDFWSPERLTLRCPPWTLTLRTETSALALTVVEAYFPTPAPARVTLLRGEFVRSFTGIDLSPVEVGGPAFVAGVQLTSPDPALAKKLFSRPGLRQKIVAEPHLALDLRQNQLRVAVVGIEDDPEKLVSLLSIGVEVLQSL